jgi:hypothetical protein
LKCNIACSDPPSSPRACWTRCGRTCAAGRNRQRGDWRSGRSAGARAAARRQARTQRQARVRAVVRSMQLAECTTLDDEAECAVRCGGMRVEGGEQRMRAMLGAVQYRNSRCNVGQARLQVETRLEELVHSTRRTRTNSVEGAKASGERQHCAPH